MTPSVHIRDLVELAGRVAVQGPTLLGTGGPISPSGLEQYWRASKARLDRWRQALKPLPDERPRREHASADGDRFVPIVEEVLTSELLSRVWCGLLNICDQRRGQGAAAPIAQTVLVGHLAVRSRVLQRLDDGRSEQRSKSEALNALRRRCERWTDLLIGHLLPWGDVGQFAFDRERARDFSHSAEHHRRAGANHPSHRLLIGSLRTSFETGLCGQSPNADLNARIAAAVVACFPPEAFDADGALGRLWTTRMQATADDAVEMIDKLLQSERVVVVDRVD